MERFQHAGTFSIKATIWHNPDCGTSRKTLAILHEAADVDLTVIEYRKTPFSHATLEQLFADARMTPREALRTRGSPAEELGLIDGASDDALLDAMVQHPILVERPFVRTEKGVRLCRPQEKVLEIL
jgi:arsenate reductase (glutaredoxin)